MKITRKIEMTIAESSIYVIRKSSSSRKIICPKCGEAMLTAEQSAKLFGITQRSVFQIIEADAAHFAENESGEVMICLPSLAEFLSGEQTIERR